MPEALPRTVREVGERLGAAAIDRLWIFPPLIQGRREWGLVAASCYAEGESRRIVTATYQARRTGKGLSLDSTFSEQGTATADRIERVMEGAARRGPAPLGAPRVVEIGGDEETLATFEATLDESSPPAPAISPRETATESPNMNETPLRRATPEGGTP